MKVAAIIFLLFLFSTNAHGQKQKVISSKKIDYKNLTPKQLDGEAEEMEEADRFLGFGFLFSIKKEENEAETKKNKKYKLELGLKMPKYLGTKPPEKTIKVGWNLSLNL